MRNGGLSDARGTEPKISLNEKLSGIQAGPLLKDLQGEERLTGTGDVSAKVTAVGAGADAIKKTLNGNVAFSFTNGAVLGINIARMIREGMAKLKAEFLEHYYSSRSRPLGHGLFLFRCLATGLLPA